MVKCVSFALAPFPLSEKSFRNGPERSRARGVCAAERTLDGEDRCGKVYVKGKGAGRVSATMIIGFLLAGLAFFLAHRFTLQLDAIRIMNESIQDAVGDGGIADLFVPVSHRMRAASVAEVSRW
jgi:hypothetical protein